MLTAVIFKSESRKKYLNLSYEGVLEYIGIKHILFTDKDNIPTKEIDKKNLSKFVSDVIYNIVAEYYDKNVKIKIEEQIYGDVKVPVELVVVHGKIILIVIQAKRKDWDQGRAQLLMQIYNAYVKNIKLDASKNHVLYGIVTTGYTWKLFVVKGAI
ncbi:unnamed protein product [Cunninghamella echinulata]